MKKTFSIISDNKKPARQVDAIKHEVKKYIARERRRDLPEGADFWDFNCKIGPSEDAAQDVHPTKINQAIDEMVTAGKQSFFIQVLAHPRTRQTKPKNET